MYSKELGEAICSLLSEGNSLRAVCRMLGLHESSVRYWELGNDEFAAQTARARKLGCDALADQTLEIADGKSPVVVDTPDGPAEMPPDRDRDRLRVDTRLRLIGKWHQHKYGDRAAVELTGKDGGPIQHAAAMSDDDLARIAAQGDKQP